MPGPLPDIENVVDILEHPSQPDMATTIFMRLSEYLPAKASSQLRVKNVHNLHVGTVDSLIGSRGKKFLLVKIERQILAGDAPRQAGIVEAHILTFDPPLRGRHDTHEQ